MSRNREPLRPLVGLLGQAGRNDMMKLRGFILDSAVVEVRTGYDLDDGQRARRVVADDGNLYLGSLDAGLD